MIHSDNPFVNGALASVGVQVKTQAALDAELNQILSDSAPVDESAEKCVHCNGTGRKGDVEYTDLPESYCFPADPTDEERKEMAKSRYDYEQQKVQDYIEQLKRELEGGQ